MNLDIVITSCIYPNTYLVNADLTTHDRILNTHDNLEWICKSFDNENIHVNIFLFESSFIELSAPDLDHLIPGEFKERINFVQVNFSDEEKVMIIEKGKGYSELLMLKKYLETNTCSDYFLKLSGRYTVLNIIALVRSSVLQCRSDIIIDYSILFKKCSTIIFYVKKDVFSEFFLTNMSKLDDRSGMFVERFFLAILRSSLLTKSKFKIRPKYPVFLKSGSHKSTYSLSKQILTDIIYKLP